MIVTRESFSSVVDRLRQASTLAIDTETTGLRPYHGDRLFSIILAARDSDEKLQSYYFNFQPYPGLLPKSVLLPQHLRGLRELLSDASKTWYAHNAKYDLAILAVEGLEIAGTVHCTQAAERVVRNDHPEGTYDLGSCADRIGITKDDAVEKYITDQHLWTWTPDDKPGKREKNPHYDRVPYDIIVPYGERDAEICFSLGEYQEKELRNIDAQTQEESKKVSQSLPSVLSILAHERRLTATVFRLERVGIRIDRAYCVRAARYESDRAVKATDAYKRETGRDFKASSKDFQDIFSSEREKWGTSETGLPSFTSEVLANLAHPAAKYILDYRDAKSKSDFYRGFLWHADRDDIVHPNFNPAGAATGRFSSSNPNFQNLTSEEDEEELKQEFIVRRAIIPRPGYVFIMPDYDQMEYRMMFDTACFAWGSETELVMKIKNEGLDPHQATADLVTAMGRMVLTRKVAKNGNFAELYGSGLDTLAATIKGTRDEARVLKEALRAAAPEVRSLINDVSATAIHNGFIRNWAGRRCYLKDSRYAYRMTNYLIQGGCADVVKIAMNRIDDLLLAKKSRMVLTIHDELPCEIHESEITTVPQQIKDIMESVYPHRYLPLTCGMEFSTKSLGDKVKGFP